MLDPEKMQHRAYLRLFFPGICLKIAVSPQKGKAAASETKIGAVAVWYIRGR